MFIIESMVLSELLLSATVLCHSAKSKLRIYGGTEADHNEYPFAVSIDQCISKTIEGKPRERCVRFCSGTVITPQWTLTASHCIEFHTPDFAKIEHSRIRYYSQSYAIIRVRILNATIHPSYILNKNHFDDSKNDIGLVKTESIQLPFYARLSPVDYTTLIGHEAIYLGYGRQDCGKKLFPGNETLKMMDVMITECGKEIQSNPNLCTNPKCGVNEMILGGDSGGTVLHASGVIAVHSGGSTCDANRPAIYAGIDVPVSPYIDWITVTITKNS